MIRIFFSTSLALALFAAPFANAEPVVTGTNATAAAEIPNDPVIATGNGFEIRHSQMDQVLATAKAKDPLEPLPADAEVRALDQLIEIQLVLQKATDAEKAEGLKEADDTIAAILKAQGPAVLQQRLQLTHMNQDQLRTMLAQEDAAQKSLLRQTGVTVTDADVKKLWDTHPGAWDQPERAHVRELLLMPTVGLTSIALPRAAIEAKHELIEDIEKKVRAGADFAALARQYNEDPISKGTGGELTMRRTKMEFGDLAFSMKPGQISDVLTNSDGFRIFQLLNFVPPKKADFATLAPRLKAGLTMDLRRQRAPGYIAQLRKQAAIEILDPDLKAKVAAADAQTAQLAQAQAQPNPAAQPAIQPPASTHQ
jgi:parvulin-like peptidyl-prolyl isomerase